MTTRLVTKLYSSKTRTGRAAILLIAATAGISLAVGASHWRGIASSIYHRYQENRLQATLAAQTTLARASAPLVIYADGLTGGWTDWSWATHTLRAKTPMHRGKTSLTIQPDNWKGVYLHHDALGTEGYGALRFFMHGEAVLNVIVYDGAGQAKPAVPLQKYRASSGENDWREVRIPLSDLGIPRYGGQISGVVLQAARAEAQPSVAFADMSLLPDDALPSSPAVVTVAVTISPALDRHPIAPEIYGMAFAPADYLSDLRLGLNRWGGNDKSRYNWVLGNADNAARDWNWANRPAYGDAPSAPSSAADAFVRLNKSGRAQTLLTIPTLGWVARNADTSTRSQNVPEGGPPLTGADGAIAGYDPTENRRRTSVKSVARKGKPFSDSPTPTGEIVSQDEWIAHLKKTFGSAAGGGVRYYAMDNEPDLWDHTHTDVHPARVGYDDLLQNFLEYAQAVKDVDPTAQITGPVSWGWVGYNYSPLDKGDDNFKTHADTARHGGGPFLAWFLKEVQAHDKKLARRTLDVLDVHFYPQGQGLYGGQMDGDAPARRLRATRALWDAKYTDESWINQPIRVLPRMKEWIAANYPGTKIGVTEWNFGADNDINGALAIGDVLGIFGRENIALANYWAFPAKNSPGYLAFKLFRNPDGTGHGFGNQSCRAVSQNEDQVAAYAAADSASGALTVILINKQPKTSARVPLTLVGEAAKTQRIQTWRLTTDNPKQIIALPGRTGRMQVENLPPYSLTLLRLSSMNQPLRQKAKTR